MDDRRQTDPIDVSGRRATDVVPTTLERQDERMDRLEEALNEIKEILKPISETYTTASTLGKWMTGFGVFISIVVGTIIGIVKLVHLIKK